MGLGLGPESARCRLRPAEPGDAAAYVDYLQRNWPRFRGAMPTADGPTFDSGTYALRFAESAKPAEEQASVAMLLVERNAPGRILGNVAFANIVHGALRACHLGYKIDGEIEGLGIMRSALETCFETMFVRYRLHRIMANYRPENLRSGALLKRLGFQIEGYARDYLHLDGEWRDHVLTSLVRSSEP
ncbi:MAG: [ribosomal protein S5]-alanine N-acetyltransferase [Sphingomonadales bacterium]|nr:[ribosomal protein S5]-alanine N-acetyltransferase [Sphingomonadales bacterium]